MFNSSFSIRTLLSLPSQALAEPQARAQEQPAVQTPAGAVASLPGARAGVSTTPAVLLPLLQTSHRPAAQLPRPKVGEGYPAFSQPRPATGIADEPGVRHEPRRRHTQRILDGIRYAPYGQLFRNAHFQAMLPDGAGTHQALAALLEVGYLIRVRRDRYMRSALPFEPAHRPAGDRAARPTVRNS